MTPDSERTAVLSPSEQGVERGTVAPRGRASGPLTLPRSLSVREHLLPGFFLLLPVVLTALVFWPGHMSADTLEQATEASTGHLNNSHSGILAALWSVVWPLGVGPGWLFVGQLVCFSAGTFLVLRAVFARLAAALVTALIAFSPPVFGSLALVGRDMWFVGFLMLSFGLLVRSAQSNWPARGRWLAASLVAGWFALASRQNASTAVVVVGIGAAALLLSRRGRLAHGRAATAKRGALAVVTGVLITIVLMATQAGLSAAIGVKDVQPAQYTFIDDLSALSQREHRDLFPTSVLPPSKFPLVDRRFDVDGGVASVIWYAGAPIPVPLGKPQYNALRHAWLHKVSRSPFEYLGVRFKMFFRQISLTRDAVWVFHPQVDPNSFGYRTRFPALDRRASDYVKAFAGPNLDGTIVHRVWIYLAAALLAAIMLLRRSRGTVLMTVGAIAASALTLQIGLLFGAPVVQYRFEHPAVIIGLVAAAVLIKLALGARVSRAGSARGA